MSELKIFKLHPDHLLPKYTTAESACFDVAFQCLHAGFVNGYDRYNSKTMIPIIGNQLVIKPGERMLVPTGLIFQLEPGTVLKMYVRSSTGIKLGLRLANSVGIIDADYFHETFIPLVNETSIDVVISHGDRLGQGEVSRYTRQTFVETSVPPGQTTERVGGFGSTGLTTGPQLLNEELAVNA